MSKSVEFAALETMTEGTETATNIIKFTLPASRNAIALLEHWIGMLKAGHCVESLTVIGAFTDKTSMVDLAEADQIKYGRRISCSY